MPGSEKVARGTEDYNEHRQVPLSEEDILAPEPGCILGKRIYFKGLGLEGHYRWRVRARHVMQYDSMTFNLPPLPEQVELQASEKIDPDDPGWVYADI